MVENGGAAAPLAARALAARDCPELRPRIEALLQNTDATLRAHAALGLAASERASAVGLLARVYEFEPNPRVRRAVIIALSQRTEPTRLRTLRLAARLDGCRRVREGARLALTGHRHGRPERGTNPFWMEVAFNRASADAAQLQRAVLLQTPSGLALPLLADPDGSVVLSGLPPGPIDARIVVSVPSGKDPATRRAPNGGK
jgi:hypothetical protein